MTTPISANPASTNPSIWKSSTAVFFLAFAVAAIFWFMLPDSVRLARSPDYTTTYEPVARNILAGHGISTADGKLATFYPPGYSVLLAALFGIAHRTHLPEGLLLQWLAFTAHALTAVFIYHIAADVWKRPFALIPAVLWITYLPALWFTSVLNSEVPFIPVFYAALLLFWWQLRRPKLSLSLCLLIGLIIGAAMLIRPVAIAAAFLLAGLLWFNRPMNSRRQRAGAIAVLLLGNLLAILPWQTLVYLRTGHIVPLSTGGLPAIIDGLTYALPDPQRPQLHVPADVLAIMEQARQAYGAKRIQSTSAAFAWLAQQTWEHPLAVLKLLAFKVSRCWIATDSHRHERLLLILQIPYLLGGLMGLFLARRWHGPARQLAVLSLVFILYFWAMTTLVLSLLRYMTPAMPLIFLLAPGLWIFLRRPPSKLPLQIANRVAQP